MLNRKPIRFTALITITTFACAAGAGDLDPPPGPIVPTMKPLDVIEPRTAIGADTTPGDADSIYRITEAGSYYLTENLNGVVGKHGIEVFTSGDVSIDLSGMTVMGVPGSLSGVFSSGRTNVVNGFVNQWGDDGVSVGAGVLERLSAQFNGRDGIRALWGTHISQCVTEINGRDGISVADVSRIDNCVTKGNGRWGIHADGAVSIADCVIYNNDGGGIEASLAHISGNMLFSNSAGGILDRGFSTITNNTVHGGGVGIRAGGNESRVERNHVMGCIVGIEAVGIDNVIVSNSVRSSTTAYTIAPGNQAGTIQATPVGAGPWDNFEN